MDIIALLRSDSHRVNLTEALKRNPNAVQVDSTVTNMWVSHSKFPEWASHLAATVLSTWKTAGFLQNTAPKFWWVARIKINVSSIYNLSIRLPFGKQRSVHLDDIRIVNFGLLFTCIKLMMYFLQSHCAKSSIYLYYRQCKILLFCLPVWREWNESLIARMLSETAI